MANPMPSLIMRERAQRNINQASFTAAENTLTDALIQSVSDKVRAYCRREFNTKLYDERYDGNAYEHLLLNQYPIESVDRVATGRTTLLEVTNTNTSTQRASVAVTKDGLTLQRVASGTATTVTSVTWSSYATLTLVATAVDAIGSGWDGRVLSSAYNNWPSADLYYPQGAFNCLNTQAGLDVYTEELGDFEIEPKQGYLTRLAGWSEGILNYRVLYTAGYIAIPEDVREACAQIVATYYWQTKRDPGLIQESIAGELTRITSIHRDSLTPVVKGLLAPYRKYTGRRI